MFKLSNIAIVLRGDRGLEPPISALPIVPVGLLRSFFGAIEDWNIRSRGISLWVIPIAIVLRGDRGLEPF